MTIAWQLWHGWLKLREKAQNNEIITHIKYQPATIICWRQIIELFSIAMRNNAER